MGKVKRIVILGNGAGGKTTLARALGETLRLPVHHVDSIQFLPEGQRRPRSECDQIIVGLTEAKAWIIEGLGSRASIEQRVRAADTVILIDFSLPTHYWWAAKRQWNSRKHRRPELPEDFQEFTWRYSWTLATGLWRAHHSYRAWFLELLSGLPADKRIIHLRTPRQRDMFLVNVKATPSTDGETVCS